MQIKIKVSDCFAFAPGLTTEENWLMWAQEGLRNQDIQPVFDLVPPNMRRRMSLSCKLALQTALYLSSKHKLDYGVFVSRHGELPRTCKLINEILSGEEASPIAFSQSVHNTASGLFTIASRNNIPVTSLAAGRDSFQQGIVEAYARLNSASSNKLLLVSFDDVVPEVYSQFVDEEQLPYALGLVLEKGNDWTVESADKAGCDEEGVMPQALHFLKHFINKKSSFTVTGTRHDWTWTC